MKKTMLALLAITFSIAQPLMAGSSLDGGEKQRKIEVSHPGQPSMGEMPQANQAEATLSADAATLEDATSAQPTTPDRAVTESHVAIGTSDDLATIGMRTTIDPEKFAKVEVISRKQAASKVKMKPTREHRKHNGGGVLGILSFVFGILGLILGFTIILWPLALLFAVVAIVLGAVGLAIGGSKVFSILGLVLGILTILIPILLFAVILAAVI